MGKRPADPSENEGVSLKAGEREERKEQENGNDVGDFEDEFEDEYESEDEIFEAGVDGRPDEEREAEERRDAMEVDQQTFIPGRSKLAAGETLTPDPSTYDMLHTLTTTWPCLSFDIARDDLGGNRKAYPATVYAVAGTQAESGREKENEIMVMKLGGLSRMERERDDSDSDNDADDDEEAAEPTLETKSIPLNSTTNRIRAHQTPPPDSSKPPTTLTATMTESAQVLIHDITPHLSSFDHPGTFITPQQSKPISTLRMHKSEGYALDWSPLIPQGKLLTGDNDGAIYVTTRTDGGGWATDSRPFTGHSGSVEDLQWSPNERNVFASASSDGTVRVWDVRSKSHKPALSIQVSSTDVNVMSWSEQTVHLLATGAEDGEWAVWDLRQWKSGSSSTPSSTSTSNNNGAASSVTTTSKPVASFTFHTQQITSIEWHPTDDSIVAVAAGDNTLTLWDLAVELDDEESRDTAGVPDVPPQLLFVHYMEMVKECHWHRQIPGVVMATGGMGFGPSINVSRESGKQIETLRALMDMAGGCTTDVNTPDRFWLLWEMVDFDGERRSFAPSEQTLVDPWCCVAGVFDNGDGARGNLRGGGGKVMRDGWTEMEKGMERCNERDDEDDEPPRYEDTDSYSPIPLPLPAPRSRATKSNLRPRLNLRGGTGSKRLGDDERVPKVIWFFAGGVGRPPTGKGLREWKEKAQKKKENSAKKNVGFWGKLGFGMVRKGKKRKQKTEKERKENAEGAGVAADGAQAADGGVVGGDAQGGAGHVASGVSEAEAGAAPGDGEGAKAGEGNAQGGAASNSSGSGSGSGSSGRGSDDSGRAE